jgi:hypothetical protein
MSKNFSALPLSGSIRTHYEHTTIKQNIISILQHIPEIDTLKGQSKLLEIVAQMVEDRIKQGNRNKPVSNQVDKKQLVIDILDKLFNLSPIEKQILSKNIDYIFEHKNIIKRNTLWRRTKCYIVSFFLDPNRRIIELMNTPIIPQQLSQPQPLS